MENTPSEQPTAIDPNDYSRRPGSQVYLLPTNAIQRAIPWLRGILSERFFVNASSAMGYGGAAAVFIGGIAAMAYFLFRAIRQQNLWLAGFIFLAPVAIAVVQYCALCFSKQGEERVRATPTSISSFAIFELLGVALALGGIAVIAFAGIDLVNGASPSAVRELLPNIGLGYLMLVIGALMLNPALLNIRQDESCTLGQEGLAVIGAVFKAVLAGSRIAFGSIVLVGALATVIGTLWAIVEPAQPGSHILFMTGIVALLVGGLLPLYAYIASAIYFVLVDALDSMIRSGRRN